MKARILFNIIACMGVGLCLYICGFAAGTISEQAEAAEPIVVTEIQKEVEVHEVQVPVYKTVTITKTVDRPVETPLTQAEKELIASVIYAEACYEDMLGKRLVADVIINRKDNEAFPNTISGVVYQKGQMHRSAGIWNEECMKAVEMEMYERIDYDVLWFNNDGYLPYGTKAYQHGGHYFCWEEM